jgi:pantetheine-phosphate adenylyltransferase
MTKYKKVAVGGTFDKFHEGHQKLIETAFASGDLVLIGVTSDEFGGMKGKIEPCKVRMSNLRGFLHKYHHKYSMARLDEPYGPTAYDKTIEALVVSEETEPTARQINQLRVKKGMKPLKIITIGMVLAEDGKPISSTRIRKGEIDVKGAVLKDI